MFSFKEVSAVIILLLVFMACSCIAYQNDTATREWVRGDRESHITYTIVNSTNKKLQTRLIKEFN